MSTRIRDLVAADAAAGGSVPPDLLVPPTATLLSPTSVVVNVATPVTVTGTGFDAGTRVVVDGIAQPTTYLSPTQVRYSALADAVGAQDVRVRRSTGLPSNALTLTVTATQEEPAPTSSNTKGEIVAWLLAHGVDLDEAALNELTKAELLVIVGELLNDQKG